MASIRGIRRLRGEVDYLNDMLIGVRTDDALPLLRPLPDGDARVRRASPVAPGVDGEEAKAAWTAWLADVIADAPAHRA